MISCYISVVNKQYKTKEILSFGPEKRVKSDILFLSYLFILSKCRSGNPLF